MAHLPIWFLGSVPQDTCDKAHAEFLLLPTQDATMGVDGTDRSHLNRNTTVRFAAQGHWFGDIMHNFGVDANKTCAWGYDINAGEAVQFAEYGPEQHYGWHVDNFPLAGHDKDRKVSVVCLLSDPAEFQAGELQLRLYSEYTAPLVKGSVIAFPSILEHRVTPVTAGLRATATMWLSGPRFR